MKVFFLPFAGGSKYSYNGFFSEAPNDIDVVRVELPGRGSRLSEPLLENIDDLVDDVLKQIGPHLREPYAIFGHSMGALLAFLITKKIINNGAAEPKHLFVSGCKAPSVIRGSEIRSSLPREVFISRLKEYGGSPDSVLNNEELMIFFEPILRADFKVVESFKYKLSEPMNIPIDVFIGEAENISYEDAYSWSKETHEEVCVTTYPGRHFFIFGNESDMIKKMVEKLQIFSK